jgi:hypothetical protein
MKCQNCGATLNSVPISSDGTVVCPTCERSYTVVNPTEPLRPVAIIQLRIVPGDAVHLSCPEGELSLTETLGFLHVAARSLERTLQDIVQIDI